MNFTRKRSNTDYILKRSTIEQRELQILKREQEKRKLTQTLLRVINEGNAQSVFNDAVINNKIDIVTFLLNEVHPNCFIGNDTPLTIAVKKNYQDMARLLIDKGANPNLPNKSKQTPLTLSTSLGYETMTIILLDKGANPNIPNKNGDTPLTIAAFKNYINIAKILMNRKADPNLFNKSGDTALMRASRYGFVEMVYALLSGGANPNLSHRILHETALRMTYTSSRLEVYQVLSAVGAAY